MAEPCKCWPIDDVDRPTSRDEYLHDLLHMPSIEQELSWDSLSIGLETETFADANTPTGPQKHQELVSPPPESFDDNFDTSFFQHRTFPTTDPSFQQNLFQVVNGSLGTQNSIAAAKAPPQKRLSCDRPGCNSSFTRQSDLERHVKSRHVKVRSYNCAIVGCERTFYRLDKLRDHESRKHIAELPFMGRDASLLPTRVEHNHAEIPLNFEYLVTSLNAERDHALEDGSSDSILKQMRRNSYRVPQNDWESSPPAMKYNYGLIEECSRVSDLISSDGSISTRSRSPCKTITSANSDTVNFSSRDQDDSTRRLFACTYQKHDPRTYNSRRYRSCVWSGWNKVTRLREHLYRCHMAPIYCGRCWAQFKTQEESRTHWQATPICESRPRPIIKGITPEIETRLRSRKNRLPGQSDEQKWREMFSLLFPGEEVPNPYYSDPNEFENEMPSSSTGSNTNGVYSRKALQRVLESLQEELLQDFRSRLQIAPVKEGGPLDAASQSHALSVLEECQKNVFGKYQARVAAGGDVPIIAQTDFIDGANIDMTFQQEVPHLPFDEDVSMDPGYGS